MTRRYRFVQADVFTATPLAGNPLAVFPTAEGISDGEMQALAREMNLSETTFVLPSSKATRRLRIFTPAAEVPLAGHPVIGTWWVLAERRSIDVPADGVHRITQETGRGVLPVDIHLASGTPTMVEMVQAPPEFQQPLADTAELARLLGGDATLIASDGPRPQVVSTALPQLMVPIAGRARLQALPSGGAGADLARYLDTLGTHCAMCYTLDTGDKTVTARCRMFAPGLGVPEDPATGSAAGALGAYLVRHGAAPLTNGVARLTLEQGIEMGRPARITVTVRVAGDAIDEVRVGGQAVIVIEGEVRL